MISSKTEAGPLVLAGMLMLLIGVLSLIEGVAALAGSAALMDADLIVGGSTSWGTALIGLGGAAGVLAVGLWAGAGVLWIAMFIAALNAIVQLLFMPAYPVWSIAVFGLDVLVIAALASLTVHERERADAR